MRILILTASLALAGCSDGGVDADRDGTITGEEVAAATADLDRPEPGRWEVEGEVIEVDIPGIPEGMGDMARSMFDGMFANFDYCLTREQAEADPGAVWKETQGDCQWEEFDIDGNRVTARAVCRGPDGSQSIMRMSGTQDATSYTATNEMELNSEAGGGRVKVAVAGRRVGDCDGTEMR